ncbi:hypothetical protein CG002_01590 [Mesoplasma florum]|uniref:Dam family site-specific DNA-(adenine-N6)-methyltransferase n=1 Tax=Mesoplasma florum TaxID=2151 RepID=UPI000D090326|nr:Dam family site-specific DNA-(adenine-N6)-methyltransferase [Mesoplasma florum]AVN65054.1 hypothetical protein CG002_01590 [Mesoplasma florum]
MNKTKVRSPLNHLGNKFRILDEIENFFKKIDKNIVLVDVFGGSGNVCINSKFTNIVYNEYDKNLFEVVKLIIKKDPKNTISLLNKIIVKNKIEIKNKETYNNFREKYNSEISKNKENKVLELLVLILYGFNSQIRFNKNKKFNVPVGKSGLTNYRRKNLEDFSNASKNKNIVFENLDFEVLINKIINKYKNNEVIFYLDPPYLISNATYNSGWNEEDELRLVRILSYLNQKGYKFVLSNFILNKNTHNQILIDFLKKNNFDVKKIKVNYSNSNYQRKKYLTEEIIIRNF